MFSFVYDLQNTNQIRNIIIFTVDLSILKRNTCPFFLVPRCYCVLTRTILVVCMRVLWTFLTVSWPFLSAWRPFLFECSHKTLRNGPKRSYKRPGTLEKVQAKHRTRFKFLKSARVCAYFIRKNLSQEYLEFKFSLHCTFMIIASSWSQKGI